jgi:hypothetical protein
MPTVLTEYRVEDGQPVLVDVLIGDFQPGGTSIFIAGNNVLNQDGDIVDFAAGDGQSLRGKQMVINTIVFERSAVTDFTSTVVSLDGGTHTHVDIPQSENPPEGVSNFLTVVRFV